MNTERRSRNPRSAAVSAEDQPQRPRILGGTRWNQRRPVRPTCCGWCAAHTAALRENSSRRERILQSCSTEKAKDSQVDRYSLIGDLLMPTPSPVFLYTTTLQNPRAPQGFYGRTDGQFSPPPIRPFRFPCPKFPCPTLPHPRTAASRPTRRASAVGVGGLSNGSFPLCVPSDLCGVPLRATTIGAFPENTAEIGRNAERERAAQARAFRIMVSSMTAILSQGGHSAQVKMRLLVHGLTVPVVQLGPDFLLVDVARELPAGDASVVMRWTAGSGAGTSACPTAFPPLRAGWSSSRGRNHHQEGGRLFPVWPTRSDD